MAGCDIAIEFDRQGAHYRGGDVVRGEVVVRCTDDVVCNGLVLHRYWQTSGKGTKDSGPRVSAVLYKGEWAAGETHRYPFHFTAPAAPLSYRGQIMRIDHYVEARADVPWSFDPKAREPFYIEPGGEGGPLELGSTATADPEIDIVQLTKGNGPMVAGIACIVIGLFTMILAPVLVPLGIGLIVWSAFVMNSRKKIGEVEVRVPKSVSPGQTLPVQLSFTPTAEAVINTVTARLVGIERATSGSGKNKKTHRATICDEVTTLSAGGQTTPGRAVNVKGAVRIPPTTAFSLNANRNKIAWRLDLCIDIAKWPDWTQRMAMRILPNVTPHDAPAPTPYAPSDQPGEHDYSVDGHTHIRGVTPERLTRADDDETPAIAAAGIVMPDLPSLGETDSQRKPLPKAPTLDSFGVAPETADIPDADDVPDTEALPDAPDIVEVQSVPTLEFDAEEAAETIESAPESPDKSIAAEADVAPEPEPAPPAEPTPLSTMSLSDAIARIAGADRISGEQKTVMSELAGEALPVSITVEKVEWTISMNTGDAYRSGRTVIGHTDDEREVALRLPSDASDTAEALKSGDRLEATGRIVEWNSLYDRPEIEADAFG